MSDELPITIRFSMVKWLINLIFLVLLFYLAVFFQQQVYIILWLLIPFFITAVLYLLIAPIFISLNVSSEGFRFRPSLSLKNVSWVKLKSVDVERAGVMGAFLGRNLVIQENEQDKVRRFSIIWFSHKNVARFFKILIRLAPQTQISPKVRDWSNKA